MKAKLLALLFLTVVTTTVNAQSVRDEHEKPNPSVKVSHLHVNTSHLNEGEFVKRLQALKAAQAKSGRDTVNRLQTSNK